MMKDQNQRNKPVYSKNFQFSIFNFQTSILIIIIIILVLIGYKTSKNKTTDYKFEANNTEVDVVDSSGANPVSQPVQNKSTDNTGQELGPATVEDLGGSSGSTNIDELLKDKEIKVK